MFPCSRMRFEIFLSVACSQHISMLKARICQVISSTQFRMKTSAFRRVFAWVVSESGESIESFCVVWCGSICLFLSLYVRIFAKFRKSVQPEGFPFFVKRSFNHWMNSLIQWNMRSQCFSVVYPVSQVFIIIHFLVKWKHFVTFAKLFSFALWIRVE